MKKIGDIVPEFEQNTEGNSTTPFDVVRIDQNLQTDLFPSGHDGIVYNERNIEAFTYFLFPHARAEGIKGVRKLELEDGKTISIFPAMGKGHYTHSVGLTMMACMKFFQDNPRPDGVFEAHFSDIIRLLGKNPKNGSSIRDVKAHLEILSDTTQDWKRSFHQEGAPTSSLRKFRFFTQYGYDPSEKGKGDNRNFNRKFVAKWHPVIRDNLLRNYINPVAYDSLLRIKNDLAGAWFRYIDTMLSPSDRKVTNHTSQKVVDLLQMKSVRLRKPANRRKVLETIIKHCHGTKLSSGELYQAKVKRTANGKDFKLVSWKKKAGFSLPTRPNFRIVNTDQNVVDSLTIEIVELTGEKTSEKWFRKLCKAYSENIIRQAISMYKDATHKQNIANKGAYFTTTVHIAMHNVEQHSKKGYEWIGEGGCDQHCSYRPENNLDLPPVK